MLFNKLLAYEENQLSEIIHESLVVQNLKDHLEISEIVKELPEMMTNDKIESTRLVNPKKISPIR